MHTLSIFKTNGFSLTVISEKIGLRKIIFSNSIDRSSEAYFTCIQSLLAQGGMPAINLKMELANISANKSGVDHSLQQDKRANTGVRFPLLINTLTRIQKWLRYSGVYGTAQP